MSLKTISAHVLTDHATKALEAVEERLLELSSEQLARIKEKVNATQQKIDNRLVKLSQNNLE